MAANRKATSFLGLPTELRNQIYDDVFSAELNCALIKGWRHRTEHERGGHTYRIYRNPDVKLQIPWVNLLSTCRTTSEEIREFMDMRAFHERGSNYTWRLALQLAGNEVGNITWQHLPCAPKDVKVLHAIIITPANGRGLSYFGDGGVRCNLLAPLWQTLNHIIHCGPRMDVHSRLFVPASFEEVVLDLKPVEQDASHVRCYRGAFGDLDYAVDVLQGPVYGLVDRITMRNGAAAQTVNIKSEGPWIQPEYWKGYGYDWGMDVVRENPPRMLTEEEIRDIDRRHQEWKEEFALWETARLAEQNELKEQLQRAEAAAVEDAAALRRLLRAWQSSDAREAVELEKEIIRKEKEIRDRQRDCSDTWDPADPSTTPPVKIKRKRRGTKPGRPQGHQQPKWRSHLRWR